MTESREPDQLVLAVVAQAMQAADHAPVGPVHPLPTVSPGGGSGQEDRAQPGGVPAEECVSWTFRQNLGPKQAI